MRRVTLGEALATLSLAADVGFGAPLETGLRVSALGLAIGERMKLTDDELDRVHTLSLLRHIGCTANADEFASIAGDEIAVRHDAARLDLADPRAMLPYLLRHVAATNAPARRPLALARLLAGSKSMMTSNAAVCEAATTFASRLGVDPATIADLNVFYERWDGKGMLRTAAGDEISPPVQAVQVAETIAAFLEDDGSDEAVAYVRSHRGAMYAPAAADVYLDDPESISSSLEVPSLWDAAADRATERLSEERVETLLELLADFGDLRSVWLGGHSRGVAALAARAAEQARLPAADVETIRQAALVHDLGRASVSAAVWGKDGPLTRTEWEQVRLHPYHVERVLSPHEDLAELGRIASFHHERCDGSGYFRGARDLPPAAKILAAADAVHAMTEDRPHRRALSLDETAAETRREVRAGRLDGDAAECVLAAAGAAPRRPEGVGGLSPREIEVLRLLARGSTKAQVAKKLVIAPKTADAHVQHIYAKLGVSTRAGATLFAMQHGLLDSLAG